MSTRASATSRRSRKKGLQKKPHSCRVVINSLPFFITKKDIFKLLKDYQVKIEKLEEVSNPELNQLKGKRCIIRTSSKEEYERLLQIRYLRAETTDGKPLFVEVEPLERKRQPPPLLKRPDESEFVGVSKRIVFLEDLTNIKSRREFIRVMKAWRIFELVEIFVFKVDKDGLSTGSIRVLLKEETELNDVLELIPESYGGEDVKVYFYSNADSHFDFKLSKEIEMEKKKIQRKLKKLFKIPNTPKKEALGGLLNEIRKETKLKLHEIVPEDEKNFRLNWQREPRRAIGRCQKRRTPYQLTYQNEVRSNTLQLSQPRPTCNHLLKKKQFPNRLKAFNQGFRMQSQGCKNEIYEGW